VDAFVVVVPGLLAIARVLLVRPPRRQHALAVRRGEGVEHTGLGARLAIFASGIYGGYFGAAQGIMLLSILGLALPDDLQRVNALKNVLAGIVNLVAAIVFALVADVAWEAVLLIGAGAVAGGHVGARYGRRLPAPALRALIVAVGVAAILQLILG
jgi:uncharacterized membrane protein YfcA